MKTKQYKCKSYYDGTQLVDCTCGKCDKPKKRGRPVGSKKKLQKIESDVSKKTHELLSLIPARDYLRNQELDKAWEDFMIPTRKELGMHRGNNEMSLGNKVCLWMAVVNVVILISLVIKNV